jgi:hypothetical protein
MSTPKFKRQIKIASNLASSARIAYRIIGSGVLLSAVATTINPAPAMAQCPDLPGTDFQYKRYPFESRVFEKYEFWTIPANPSKRKSINFWETAQRFNAKPPAQPPDFVCFYDGPGNKYYNTNRPEVLHFTCKHKSGKIFWNREYAPVYVVNKNNDLTAVDTYTDPRDGLGSNSGIKESCKAKRAYSTSVFFMRPCKIDWDGGSYTLNQCGEIINYLGVVRRQQVLELIERTKFEGF